MAPRTRVCFQTERGAVSRMSSLGLLLKRLAALSTLPCLSCLSSQCKPPSSDLHQTPILISVPPAAVVGNKKGSSCCLKLRRGKSGRGCEPGLQVQFPGCKVFLCPGRALLLRPSAQRHARHGGCASINPKIVHNLNITTKNCPWKRLNFEKRFA